MSDRKICGLARAMAIGSIAAKFAAEEINLDNFRGAIVVLEVAQMGAEFSFPALGCLGDHCGMHGLCQSKNMKVSGEIKLQEPVPGLL